MTSDLNRRNVLKMSMASLACVAVGGIANTANAANNSREVMLKAGIITDMHKTTKEDSATRKYSASSAKMTEFIKEMNKVKPAFLVELGDFVDMLGAGTDPVENLSAIDKIYCSYGPAYHVLGNHEFDNVTREVFLNNISNPNIPKGQTWYSWDINGIHFIVLDADYTPNNYRPYDMNTPQDTFWTWKDTCIPPQEMEWLAKDLADTNLPVIVFTHQTLDRPDDNDHNIKNASEVRALLEKNGKVLAVISGHDHQGGYSNIKGIHYLVLNGNVGVHDYRPWDVSSEANGLDPIKDNQFAVLEIRRENNKYILDIQGYGRLASFILERTLA